MLIWIIDKLISNYNYNKIPKSDWLSVALGPVSWKSRWLKGPLTYRDTDTGVLLCQEICGIYRKLEI